MLSRLFLNERFILMLITLNALVIFLHGFSQQSTPIYLMLETADHALTMLFILEAGLKVLHLGWRYYLKDRWNLFDLVLLVMAIPSLLVWMYDIPSVKLQFLLIFRVLRVFKFFRVLKFIPNIDHLMAGIGRAARSSLIILMAFFIFNFIIAVLSFSFFGRLAPEYFGDPLISFYSVFKVFTVEGWYEIPDVIADRSNAMVALCSRLYFVVLLFGGGIFGLSLINSIFVDSMMSDNTEGLEQQVARLDAKMDELLRVHERGKDPCG
jgi:voltage-gated sodium channel